MQEQMTAFQEEKQEKTKVDDYIREIPPEFQIDWKDVSPEANLASFICFGEMRGIPRSYLEQVSKIPAEGVESIISESRRLNMFESLAQKFLKKG